MRRHGVDQLAIAEAILAQSQSGTGRARLAQ
jgi:hypothetical protein